MDFKKITLSRQIFLSMIALIVFSFLIMLFVTKQQIKSDRKKYHIERLGRKDRAVAKSIEAMIDHKNPDLYNSFSGTLQDVAYIHKLILSIYDLEGNFVLSTDTSFINNSSMTDKIPQATINQCVAHDKKKISYDKQNFHGTYRILYKSFHEKHHPSANHKFHGPSPIISNHPFCILDVAYSKKDILDDIDKETNAQIKQLMNIYGILLFFAVGLAYFLLKQITSPIKAIAKHLSLAKIKKNNKPLTWHVKDEIGQLIAEYNTLMEELEKRTQELIKSEKEGAWKKMAKQVAHEIKNPLTPMRLSVQYLEKSFNDGAGRDLYSDNWRNKLSEFSKTMIQQIDTLTRIANSFSDFASLNVQNEEPFYIEEEIRRIVNLFKNNNVAFVSSGKHLNKVEVCIDKSHLTRVLNNLVKNSLQAAKENVPLKVVVELKATQENCMVAVSDNGTGIPESAQDRVFEPNFTTKNSGMGLGLAMVKKIIDDFGGSIDYSTSNKGTIFHLKIPLNK